MPDRNQEVDVFALVESVRTREDFVRFLGALKDDLLKRPSYWQNYTLEQYLDGLDQVVQGTDRHYKNLGKPMPEQPDWRMFADILLSATMYE